MSVNRRPDVCGRIGRRLSRLTQAGTVLWSGEVGQRRVVVGMDGGRVRLREPRKGRTRKGRRKFSARWREPRLFIIDAVDAEGHMADDFPPIIDGTLGTCERLFEMIQACVIGLKITEASRVLFLADGAAWIWRRIPKLIG